MSNGPRIQISYLQGTLKVTTSGTPEKAAYSWTLPPATLSVISPAFLRFERRWRVLLDKDSVGLRYDQGVQPINLKIMWVEKTKEAS